MPLPESADHGGDRLLPQHESLVGERQRGDARLGRKGAGGRASTG
jgi:hypothetical protein